MESLTKPKITRLQIENLFVHHFGERPEVIEEATNGWFGAVYMVALSERQLVLKVAPPNSVKVLRYEKGLLAAEAAVNGLVSENTHIPVAPVQFFVSQDGYLGAPYMITDRIEGVTLGSVLKNLTTDQRNEVDCQIGDILSQLHAIQGPSFGMWNGPHFDNWHDAFLHLTADLQQDAIDASVQVESSFFELFHLHAEALREVETPSLVHWDLWDENILINPETLQITGVVDFERAMWGDPLLEWNFKKPSASLLASYPSYPADPYAATRRKLYTLYLALILVIETTYRGFPKDHLAWCEGELRQAVEALDS